MAAMKLRYPDGVPLDDLEVTQKYRLEFRSGMRVMVGELRAIVLKRGKPPALTILPDGKPFCVDLGIHKIKAITLAELDFRNSDYRDDGGGDLA